MKKEKTLKVIAFSVAGIVGLCLVIIAALFIISGFFMPKKYMEPWQKDYATQFSDPRVSLAAVGLLAASNHNMQPWKIKLDKADPMVFYLYADSTRRTEEVDPNSRQMMISQGTFLEYVAVAGDKTGWHTDITLFPDGVYDESHLAHSMDLKPVAKITLSKTHPQDDKLYSAMFLPDTNREAYKPEKLNAEQENALTSLSAQDGLYVKLYQDTADLSKIGGFAIQSAAIESSVTRVMDESNAIFRPNEYLKDKYRYGYSVEGQGSAGFMKNIIQGLVTIFPTLNTGKAASENFIKYTRASVDSTPAYAMIVTDDNSRITQIESGMLYSRLVLTGHELGLAMQPLSQALEEYPEMKAPYDGLKQAFAPGGTIQMLFRVGEPTKDTPLSMRRDVGDLIIYYDFDSLYKLSDQP
ncbi:hypothetical protein DCCM_2321 [Desulfocucumis palustris]|uniref:Nitroreductase domain-containing protein n=1 Tax=Desulfocucumis palustris TaxID=1898651 RepID=A0A2L2XAX1_9FIRM|nr:hypothetical protein [Desulfocucumis palustris]GBF33222.1 hypothetical protein DCCM_2321 [Desulfocucumis palustris]